MSTRPAPDWLAELQARFGAMICTPLDPSSGTLRATPEAYDETLVSEALDGPRESGRARLAVYNRQYWFRLLSVMHTAFPLTTRLFGHWHFNAFAARFLAETPPRAWDIDRVAHGFDAWLIERLAVEVSDVEPAALIEAARIDAAWQGVFRAPETPVFRPTAEDAPRLLDARLVPSPAVALVEESWPLLELRRSLRDDASEARLALPARLPSPRAWALVRRPEGIGHLPLEPREAELFWLLRAHSVRDALYRLEAACSEAERTDLPVRANAWLRNGVELGFFSGIEP